MRKYFLAVFVFCIAFASLALLPQAHAHVSVINTIPQYQSTVQELPSKITITFNSPLVVLGSKNSNTITVLNPNKKPVTLQEATVDGAVISIPIDTSNPVAGAYTVRYSVVSDDGHRVSGTYSFGVSDGLAAQALPETTTDEGHGFWHLHLTHVLQGAGALLLIGLWALYRLRFAPRK